MVVEGAIAVSALLKSSAFRVREVSIESGRHSDLLDRAVKMNVPVRVLSAPEIAEEAGYEFHRGVLAVADRPPPKPLESEFLPQARRLVAPVGLADPGNLGTIIRTAAAFGVDGIVLEADRGADVYSRKCIRASATAIFQLPVFEVPSMRRFVHDVAKQGFVIFGTAATQEATALPKVRPAVRNIVFLGAEKDGLPDWFSEICDEWIRIPMAAVVESLNVSAAAAVVLYELFGRGESE